MGVGYWVFSKAPDDGAFFPFGGLVGRWSSACPCWVAGQAVARTFASCTLPTGASSRPRP